MNEYTLQTTGLFTPVPDHTYYFGIDPGTKNGISIFDRSEQRFVYARTLLWWDLIFSIDVLFAPETQQQFEVIIEDIIGNKITFQRGMLFAAAKSGSPQNIAKAVGMFDKRAQDVGGNKRDEQHLLDWFEKRGVVVHRIVPKKNSQTKKNAAELKDELGITSRTSPHSRDSIYLVWNFLQAHAT